MKTAWLLKYLSRSRWAIPFSLSTNGHRKQLCGFHAGFKADLLASIHWPEHLGWLSVQSCVQLSSQTAVLCRLNIHSPGKHIYKYNHFWSTFCKSIPLVIHIPVPTRKYCVWERDFNNSYLHLRGRGWFPESCARARCGFS